MSRQPSSNIVDQPRRYGRRSMAVRKASIRRPIKRPWWLIARSTIPKGHKKK